MTCTRTVLLWAVFLVVAVSPPRLEAAGRPVGLTARDGTALTGQVFDASLIGEVVRGIEAAGALGTCDGVLSGYMGAATTGEAILDAVARVKGANPQARYCCDPVIGDVESGVFVREGIPEFMKSRAVPAADADRLEKPSPPAPPVAWRQRPPATRQRTEISASSSSASART